SGSCRCGPCYFSAVIVRFPPVPKSYTRICQFFYEGTRLLPFYGEHDTRGRTGSRYVEKRIRKFLIPQRFYLSIPSQTAQIVHVCIPSGTAAWNSIPLSF
ncbi:hypothetical protein HMPREF1545_00927, partial [Oscillibacter sp. KLE 1728]